MNLLKAMNRLSYTVSNGHKCNDTDVDALNFVIDWVNKEKEERLCRNHHFAKLAMYIYNHLLIHYKGDNKFAEKEIMHILEVPLEHHYQRFKSLMDMYSLNGFFDAIGAQCSFWEMLEPGNKLDADKVREEYKHNKEIFKSPENHALFLEHLETNMYEMQEVHEKLNHFLSEILHRYEDKDHDLHWLLKYTNKEQKENGTTEN